MENEQAFEVITNTESSTKLRSRPPHRGHDMLKIATDGIETQRNSKDERTPLLAKARDDSEAENEGSNPYEENGENEWSGDKDFAGRPWWKRPSVLWLLPGFLLYTLAFGGIIVPKINLILNLICRQYFSSQSTTDPHFRSLPIIFGVDNPQCQIPEVQSLVSQFTLYGNLVAGLLSAVTSPKLGSLSDRYGRIRLIFITTGGTLVGEVIFILAATYPDTIPVQWLMLGYFFEGLSGSFTASMALIGAYNSDCTAPAKRNVVFGYFHACLFGGIAVGPIIAGYIVKASGNILTSFYVALACHCSFLVFLLLVIPESLTKERRQRAREKKSFLGDAESTEQTWYHKMISFFRGSNLLAPLAILYPSGQGVSKALRRNLTLLAAVDTIMFGVGMGSMTVVIIYSELMFGWGNFESSVFVSIVNSFRVFILLVLLPVISRIVRGPSSTAVQKSSGSDLIDLSIIRGAVLFDFLGYVGYTTARTGPLFILAGSISSFGAVGSPALQAAMTKHVSQDRIGELLGAMGLLHALARVVAPTVFNLIYSLTVAKFPQTVFITLTAAFGVAFVLSWLIKPSVYWDEAERSKSNAVDTSDDEH